VAGSLGFAFSFAGGTSLGNAPIQRHWQIGGSSSIRGYDAAALRGESVWLGRGELSFGPTFLGLNLFGDAGWAGERADFGSGKPLTSAGVGVSVMGGLLRVDVARGFGEGGGTRVYLRLGGAL
jgi:hemolysin activation/secretion protein